MACGDPYLASVTKAGSVNASLSLSIPRPAKKSPLRLSPVLRFAIATAESGKPALLPLRIPKACCGKLFSCKNQLAWKVSDGRNEVWMCRIDFELFWESGQNVLDYQIERL